MCDTGFMEKRAIGKSGIEVSAIGMGCWAIGGPFYHGTTPIGWGKTDDGESLNALAKAYDMGINFFDTADVYGAGHSERLVGKAFAGRRDRVVIATKFGGVYDEEKKQITGQGADPDFIVGQCERSLKRLGTDYIDLYQFHTNEYPADQIEPVAETLERLAEQGKIRAYGWSTDDPLSAQAMVGNAHYHAVQFQQNVIDPNWELNTLTASNGLLAINRGPLAMGLLSGKYSASTTVDVDDVRGPNAPPWMQYFTDGKPSEQYLARLQAIREILTSDERSLVQGSLAWSVSAGGNIVPIPGIRTVAQAAENFAEPSVRRFDADQLAEIERLRDGSVSGS